MAARVVHFGLDECARLLVLQHAGYSVESCGTSLPKLAEHLRREDVLAVAVTEDGPIDCEDVVAITRAATPAPLILFAGMDDHCETSDFDLVIRPGVRVAEWLQRVQNLLEGSERLRQQSSDIRVASSELRQASQQTRAATRKILEELRRKKP